jgi:hypothetical protein
VAIAPHNFRLVAGQRFPVSDDAGTFTYEDANGLVDLTGYTAKLKAREYPDATTSIVSLTNGAGITLGGVLGTIVVAFTAVQTAAMGEGVFPYDLVLIPPTGVADQFVFIAGFLNIDQMMSRA